MFGININSENMTNQQKKEVKRYLEAIGYDSLKVNDKRNIVKCTIKVVKNNNFDKLNGIYPVFCENIKPKIFNLIDPRKK